MAVRPPPRVVKDVPVARQVPHGVNNLQAGLQPLQTEEAGRRTGEPAAGVA